MPFGPDPPPLLKELEDSGIRAKNIFFIIASGLHRPCTLNEKRQLVGDHSFPLYILGSQGQPGRKPRIIWAQPRVTHLRKPPGICRGCALEHRCGGAAPVRGFFRRGQDCGPSPGRRGHHPMPPHSFKFLCHPATRLGSTHRQPVPVGHQHYRSAQPVGLALEHASQPGYGNRSPAQAPIQTVLESLADKPWICMAWICRTPTPF